MKEQFIFYGVCTAISFVAVAITSLIKLIVGAIAKKHGGGLSGNAKEYIFTPLAILLAAGGLFVWMNNFCFMEFNEKFILILVSFSIGTMLLYLLLFQPTRKFALMIIRNLARSKNVAEVIGAVKTVLTDAEKMLTGAEDELQSDAEEDETVLPVTEENLNEEDEILDAEAEKLRAMVEIIKKQ